uniref:Uncharacterized protein n=1 Tax=Myoviridae sp. ctuev19 TaxID=2827716 RepID=A0A8S5SFE3_9CAUD|nr:MAG TPA: hypothetical protein [Myoviridae sp. ctuev19]
MPCIGIIIKNIKGGILCQYQRKKKQVMPDGIEKI